MDKHLVEALAFNYARRQRIATQAAARRQVAAGMVEQAPPLTPAMIDTYRLRTQAREEARRNNVQAYLARKRKKLPLPTTGIFACENTEFDCGEAGHAEGRCGNAQCLGRVKVRLS